MKKTPLVSVIVPIYNSEKFLDETLQSVYDQTYENWECIMIDDGSQDSSKIIAKKWYEKDIRFKYFYKENSGVTDTRNLGIAYSNGEYIAFLDSDDVLTQNSLEVRLNTLLEKNVDLVFSYAYVIKGTEYTQEPTRSIEIGFFKGADGVNKFLHNNNITTSSCLCKKSFLDKVGGFNWYKNAEDLYCWIELLLNGASFYGLSDFLVYYRVIENSLSSENRRCYEEIIALIWQLRERLASYGTDYQTYLNIWIRMYVLQTYENKKIKPHIKKRLEYVNSVIPHYFPNYLIWFPLGENLRKILSIRTMNTMRELHKISFI